MNDEPYKGDMMGRHFLIYGHGGSYNHGCEALARTTTAFLRHTAPDCRVTLSTHFAEQDREFALPVDEYAERNINGKTNAEIYAATLDRITSESVCIHIGGDNYCYPNWRRWADIHYAALSKGAKSVLWSCSIDKELLDDEMLAALRTHHLITAREKLTYRALLETGLTNVIKVADIAFALNPEPVDFELSNFVALNVSPLVLRKNPAVLSAWQTLVNYIITETDMNIAFVPHVAQPVDNDCDAFQLLDVSDAARAVYVSGRLSAANYKYIISKARFCVAARTHAAIAAYSSCVPTLAVGYSSKSCGIAADLGMDAYAVDVDNISELTGMFRLLMRNENRIRQTLGGIMPQYARGATDVNIGRFWNE
jgi:polysaccharide pyruvyl transferase WcaK-like protein